MFNNKKGFISTSIIYTFFTFILLSLSLYLVNIKETNILQNEEVKKIKEDLNNFDGLEGLAKRILLDNGGKKEVVPKPEPDFTMIAHTNEGLNQSRDDHGLSYYFRGAVNNNWVYFGGFYWRVIRINGDGSVRMIYSGTQAPTSLEATVMTGTQTELAITTAFSTLQNRAEYLGYMYTLGMHRGHVVSSLPKSALETWYSSTLIDYDDYIHDAIFCVDREIINGQVGGHTYTGNGHGTTPTAFAPSARVFGSTDWLSPGTGPKLTCPDKEDRYTVSDTIIGNGQLSQKIGLINSDEAIMAGSTGGDFFANHDNAKKHYLYTNRNYWMISPAAFDSMYPGAFYMTNHGYSNFNEVVHVRSLRPVINLKPSVDGTGTGIYNDPYVVIT